MQGAVGSAQNVGLSFIILQVLAFCFLTPLSGLQSAVRNRRVHFVGLVNN